MPLFMPDLERLAGVSARTIRTYIRRGLVAAPERKGLGAQYDDEQVDRAVAIARMRASHEAWDVVVERMSTWSLAKIRAYVRKTNPAPPPAPPAAGASQAAPAPGASSPDESPLLEGEPVPRGSLPGKGGGAARETAVEATADGPSLPAGRRWILAPLLPGLVLMIDEGASAVVRRMAGEIVDRYGLEG